MKTNQVKGLFIMLSLAVALTGCAGGKKTRQDINLLKTQVGGLTTELNRISEENRFAQESLKEEQSKRAQLEADLSSGGGRVGSRSGGATTQAGVYRTPSGFELRATELQAALKNAGYYTGSIDGKVGNGTIDAIRRFQADNELTADGVCGRKTWTKLSSFTESAVK